LCFGSIQILGPGLDNNLPTQYGWIKNCNIDAISKRQLQKNTPQKLSLFFFDLNQTRQSSCEIIQS